MRRIFFLLVLFILIGIPAKMIHAVPTGTGGENFPLGSDAGDDFNVDSGVLVEEGDNNNVGIGSISPRSKLDVVGTVTATAFVGDGSALTGLSIGGWTDGGTNVYVTTSTDNVGIGTTQPSTQLDIEGTLSAGAIDINNTAADGDPVVIFALSGTSQYAMGVDDSDGDKFKIGTTAIGTSTRFVIDSSGNVGVGTDNPIQGFIASMPATETVGSGGTITANACGTVKGINSSGSITTDTTNTFTAPDGTYAGCCMDVINVDSTDTITLDANTNFKTNTGGNIALGPNDGIYICSDGSFWYQIAPFSNN